MYVYALVDVYIYIPYHGLIHPLQVLLTKVRG